jgi:hypothetical protein
MSEELHPRTSGLQANPDPPALRRRLPIRILRRALYSAAGAACAGAILGALIVGVLGGIHGLLHQGIAGAILGPLVGSIFGAVFGAIVGAMLGAFSGATAGGFAWVFDGPWKGALRCGALFAALAGLLGLGVVIASAPGWDGAGPALAVLLEGVAIGTLAGAALGAFLGWLGGPIFRESVEELDKRSA